MIRILCSILIVTSLFSCTQQLAGNGSEITNGYCVSSATAADSAMVVAYPSDYLPYPPSAGPETTFTDKNGRFSLRLGRKGWNLVIYDRFKAFGAFFPLPRGDSAVDTVVLRGVGSISGIVYDTVAGPRYIGIIGTPFYAGITGKTDTFSLMKIPAFYYTLGMWRWGEAAIDSLNKKGPPIVNNFLNGSSSMVRVLPDSATYIIINP